MLQVALVPPYGEVDNAVKPIPKSDGEARRYATEVIREHGRKKRKNFLLDANCRYLSSGY